MKLAPITATEVRFIKLGESVRWKNGRIEGQEPCIVLGFTTGHHALCHGVGGFLADD